jgi:hypothetical protein
VHSVRTITAVATPGIVWLLAAARGNPCGALFCFILCYAAHSVIVGMLQLGYAGPHRDAWRLGGPAVLRSWLVFAPAYFLPFLTAGWPHPTLTGSLTAALTALPLLAGAAILYRILNPLLGKDPQDRIRWFGYGTIALSVSLAGALVYF